MFALLICTPLGMSIHALAERAAREPQNALESLFDSARSDGRGLRNTLPPPTMPDGLDAYAQRAVVLSLIRDDYSYEDFTRRSVVAPQRLRIRALTSSDENEPVHGVDVWYVAYDDKLIGGLSSGVKSMRFGRPLAKSELEKRGIEFEGRRQEAYRHVEFDFLGKFHVRATVRTAWVATKQSVLMVAEVDPRFLGDPDFPNQWQPVVRKQNVRSLGTPQPWDGAKFYTKITKLAYPAGALFVEQHFIFAEPAGWFDGANLLRSKLPHVVQNAVRNTRREWAAAGW